jgi:heterodisulfide reductase subunit A-like polyferredoxin
MSFHTPSESLLQVHVLQGENANKYARSYCICTCLFVERTEQEENIQFKEYQDHIQQLREAYEAQGEAYQQLYLQHEEAQKVRFLRQLFNF